MNELDHDALNTLTQRLMLVSLNEPVDGRAPKHIYGGTVPAPVVAARRRRNKAARVARRANRRSQA